MYISCLEKFTKESSMESIVLELQREAYEQNTSVSILLRKAYVLSKKLKVTQFEKWIDLELNGYMNKKEIPNYRIINGEMKAFNPYNGYIPAYFPHEVSQNMNKRILSQPITEIESFIQGAEKKAGIIIYKLSPDVQQRLMEFMKYPLELSLHVPSSQLQKITDRVRNIILEWTLKLEDEGVVGENMIFSDSEKKKATKSEAIIVNIIGSINNSQLQQNTINSKQNLELKEFKNEDLKKIISDLKDFSQEMNESKIKEELNAEIGTLEIQSKSPNPKRGIIKEALKSIRNITEGTTGSMLATIIQEKVKLLLSFLN